MSGPPLSRTSEPRNAVNCPRKATFCSFQATIKGCAFCPQETFVHHTTAHIFLQRTFRFFLIIGDLSYSELVRSTFPISSLGLGRWKLVLANFFPPQGLVWEGGNLSGSFFSPDPRDFLAWGPTPRLGLGGWELVWSTFSELYSELFPQLFPPLTQVWEGINLSGPPCQGAKPRTALNRETESNLWHFPSHHQGIGFLLSGNNCAPHHSSG